MQRKGRGLGGSSALSWSLGFAVAAACNVYDSSLLTGGSEGQGGNSEAGEGSGGDSGTSTGGTGTGGSEVGGTSGKGGSSGDGGTGATAGSGTGGSKGGASGTTGGTGKGGTDPTGGDAGDTSTGGKAGSGAGDGGKGGGAGDGGSSTMGGSGGSGSGGGGAGGSAGACGKCGCGKADTPDTDMDGVLDCIDMCANLNDADCAVLKSGLAHRYSFSGTGTAVMDTKGTAHGTAMGVNAGLSGSGTIVLTGGISPQSSDPNKQYVDLPDNLLTGLTNATFEAWMTWTTPTSWQRVFDFGSAATGTTGAYVFLTLRAGGTGSVSRVAISTAGSTGETAAGGAQINGAVITTAVEHHFAVIINDTGNTASLYVDGVLGSTVSFTGTIASLVGANNWLGRSNYTTANDAYLGGTFDEFRIYSVALTSTQLDTSRTAGPNATLF